MCQILQQTDVVNFNCNFVMHFFLKAHPIKKMMDDFFNLFVLDIKINLINFIIRMTIKKNHCEYKHFMAEILYKKRRNKLEMKEWTLY